jgi:HlyD family secretion protein
MYIAIAAAVLLLIVVAIVWQNLNARATASAVQVQTTTVQRGSLAASVSAAGNISSPSQVSVAFQSSCAVTKVNVNVGDAVKKDQVLMELDNADLTLALKTAQLNLASAQASYDQTKADLNYALRDAQSTLVSSKANLDAAKAKNDQNPNAIIVAKAALDKATVTVQQAQANYNTVAWRPDVGMTAEAATLQQATIDYQSALASYKTTQVTINDTALKQAQTQYDTDQVSLEQAQRNVNTKLSVAQAQLDDSKVALEQAQRNLDKAKIIAPFDGVVSAVNFSIGDYAGSTAAVTVVNLSNLQIKVTVAEVDMPKVKVGNTAQVTLDALPGRTYNAKTTAISPAGTVTQGVVNYSVILTITDADDAIKPGMTANLTIEVERRDDVLILPTRAVRTQGNQRIVTVQFKGQSIQTSVTTGLSNDQSIEITSGLQQGDVVVLNQTQTRATNNIPGGGGIPFLGGR